MGTIVTFEVPAEGLALGDGPAVTAEPAVAAPGPLSPLRVRGADPARLRTAPAVESATVLAADDDGCLCRVEWAGGPEILLETLAESGLTVLAARCVEGRWKFRALAPDRPTVAEARTRCRSASIPLEVTSLHDRADPVDRFGLTSRQRETVTTAFRQGFYEVPREATVNDLASDRGVSHQALSERFRRAHGALVGNALVVPER